MDITVNTRYGILCGEAMDGYVQFLGVPYAKPPVGELRFRKPEQPDAWIGVRQAKRFGDYCVQPGVVDTMVTYTKASEDCLHLNIFTPACDGRRRPVAVWIHGGAYLTGTNSSATKLGGKLCRDSDIVVVAIQYRLGAFGCVDFASLSGARNRFDSNCGTWDQVAAVRWVIDNIDVFGGDPECITLMGESAGGSSVLTLMTTPYLKGKIRRAVLESPAPHLMQTKENGYRAAMDVVRRLGITEEDAWRIAELPAEELNRAVEESEYDYVNRQPYLLPTAPVVDGDLLPELPYDAVMHGAVAGIDILMGTTKDEGSVFATGGKRDLFPATEAQLDRFFRDHPQVDRHAVLFLYQGLPAKKRYQEIGKEIFFHLPCMELAERLAQTNRVFVYQFNYAFPVLRLLGAGAAHCTNSALTAAEPLTGVGRFYGLFAGSAGKQLTETVHSRWGGFIGTGTPGSGWSEYGQEKQMYVMDKTCEMRQADFRELRAAYGRIRPYGN